MPFATDYVQAPNSFQVPILLDLGERGNRKEASVVHRTNTRRDALAMLGLSGTPTPAEITAAYRRRVRDTHPDTAASDDQRGQFGAVVDAYQLLRRADINAHDDSARPVHTPDSEGFLRPVDIAVPGRRGDRPPIVAGPATFVPSPRRRDHG